MKKLITLVFILFASVTFAQSHHVVSPFVPNFGLGPVPPPIAHQNFYLLSPDSGCYTSNYTVDPRHQVEIMGQDVRVFFQHGLGGSTTCVSPTPPRYLERAEINGLSSGSYTMHIYSLPYGDAFPPDVADYPSYLIESFSFGVNNPPAVVNSTNTVGLVIMLILMFLMGMHFNPKKPKRDIAK